MKRKKRKNGYYLLTSDIEELQDRYAKLYHRVQDDYLRNDATKNQLTKTCEVILGAYNLEVEQLNDLRYAEYTKRKARADAKDAEQIPWRRCWLWRLLFRPVTNRAQDIIEEEAELEADQLFTSEEKKLDELAGKLYGENEKPLSERRRKRALKKYLKYKRLLNLNEEAAIERFEAALDKASDNAPPFTEPTETGKDVAPMENAEQAAEPPEPPARKPRKTKQQLGVEPL